MNSEKMAMIEDLYDSCTGLGMVFGIAKKSLSPEEFKRAEAIIVGVQKMVLNAAEYIKSTEEKMNITEAARICGVSRQTFHKWLNHGVISSLDLETEKTLRAWIDENSELKRVIDPYANKIVMDGSDTGHGPELMRRIEDMREDGLEWQEIVSELLRSAQNETA